MTHQDFNNMYYTFTNDKKGVRYNSRIFISGNELKEFVEYAIKLHLNNAESQQSMLNF
ncbi:MAG: hypothetical protein JKY02_07365 [Flavobacteriaceae bacterium]|nr:hypothetical protein [Flavobacteriaceae bacterium]